MSKFDSQMSKWEKREERDLIGCVTFVFGRAILIVFLIILVAALTNYIF